MSRIPRRQQWTAEACYDVRNRGHNRERIFGDDDDRLQFHLLLARYLNTRPAELSRWLAGMLHAYVHYFNRRYGFVGHLW
jgi:hypothetical protein